MESSPLSSALTSKLTNPLVLLKLPNQPFDQTSMNFTNTDLAKVIVYNKKSKDATDIARALAAKFKSEGFTPILKPCTRGKKLKSVLEKLMRDSDVQNEQLKNKPTFFRTLPPTDKKNPRSGRRQKIERVVLIDLNADRATYEFLEFNRPTLEIRNIYAFGARVVNRVMTDGVEVVTRVDEVKYHADAVVTRQVALVVAYDINVASAEEDPALNIVNVTHHFLRTGDSRKLPEWMASWENFDQDAVHPTKTVADITMEDRE